MTKFTILSGILVSILFTSASVFAYDCSNKAKLQISEDASKAVQENRTAIEVLNSLNLKYPNLLINGAELKSTLEKITYMIQAEIYDIEGRKNRHLVMHESICERE